MLHQFLVQWFLFKSVLISSIFEKMKYNLLDSIQLATVLSILVLFFYYDVADFVSLFCGLFLQLFLFELLSSSNSISYLFLSLPCFFIVFFRQFICCCYLNTLSELILFLIFQRRFLRHEFPAFLCFLDRLIRFAGWLFADQLVFFLIIEYLLFFFVGICATFPARKELSQPWLWFERLNGRELTILGFAAETKETAPTCFLFWRVFQRWLVFKHRLPSLLFILRLAFPWLIVLIITVLISNMLSLALFGDLFASISGARFLVSEPMIRIILHEIFVIFDYWVLVAKHLIHQLIFLVLHESAPVTCRM